MMYYAVLLCFLAVCISRSQAQFCSLLTNGGECVNALLPCPAGKERHPVYNCGSQRMNCCYFPPSPPPPPPPTCGIRTLRTSRIFNGQNAGGACKWPWAVSIRIRQNSVEDPNLSNTENLCNGVLVKPNVVLTSASCLHVASISNRHGSASTSTLVVAGDYNTETLDITSSGLREEFSRVRRAVIHPNNFQPNERLVQARDLINPSIDRESYNLAVLILENDIDLGQCRELACLPTNMDIQQSQSQTRCYMASWGTFDSTNNPSTTLKEASVNLYEASACRLVKYQQFLPGGTTCGRVPNRHGVCQGDDGGMVICEDAGTWKLFGLIDYPFYQRCLPAGTNVLTFTDLRNQTMLNWINAQY